MSNNTKIRLLRVHQNLTWLVDELDKGIGARMIRWSRYAFKEDMFNMFQEMTSSPATHPERYNSIADGDVIALDPLREELERLLYELQQTEEVK